MTPILFNCGQCSQALKVPESAAGKVFLCPQCRARVTAPFIATLYDPESAASYPIHQPVQRPPLNDLPAAGMANTLEKPKTKKARKLTQDERLLAEEIPWYVRHLHWLLLLALIPLIASLLRGHDKSDVMDRLKQTMDQLSDDDKDEAEENMLRGSRRRASHMESFFEIIPNHKLIGAWLPRDSSMHWLVAGATGFFFLQFFIILSVRTTAKPWQLVLVALFTATLGILLLEFIQIIAMISQSPWMNGPSLIILWPFKLIGLFYNWALDDGTGFIKTLSGFIFSVGLCEELIKLLPVFLYLKMKKPNWHGAFLWGLSSGVGFGLAEGLEYASGQYNGVARGDAYFLRFISCVALHAILSGSVAIMCYMLRGRIKQAQRWWDKVLLVIAACSIPMFLHGLFDAFLKLEMNWAALIVALMSFGFLALLDWALQQHQVLSFLRHNRLAKV